MEQRICAHCQTPFIPTNHIQIYCSEKCRIIVKSNNRRERRSAGIEINSTGTWKLICKNCGLEFNSKSPSAKTCSKTCKYELKVKQAGGMPGNNWNHTCIYCKKDFISKSVRSKYCSSKCKYLFERVKENKELIIRNKYCNYCGLPMSTKKSDKNKIKFCCTDHKNRYYHLFRTKIRKPIRLFITNKIWIETTKYERVQEIIEKYHTKLVTHKKHDVQTYNDIITSHNIHQFNSL